MAENLISTKAQGPENGSTSAEAPNSFGFTSKLSLEDMLVTYNL